MNATLYICSVDFQGFFSKTLHIFAINQIDLLIGVTIVCGLALLRLVIKVIL